MQELGRYRLVLIEVACPAADHPISWETHTTRTDDQIEQSALSAARLVCQDRGEAHWRRHSATITTIPEQSTGARRA